MNAYYTSALACGIVIAVLFAILVALEIVRVYRTQINTDLAEDTRRLRAENALIRSRHATMTHAEFVHTRAFRTLENRVDALERENEELKRGTPVCTGYVFVKSGDK